MLQQTQLSTVLKRFDPFINLFPDVFSLASSKQESVVLAWSGLGFYRRAINLHEASKILCAQKNFKLLKTKSLDNLVPEYVGNFEVK